MCVMVNDPKTGKGKILHVLLDSGYTKSIILKKFTSPKAQTRLNKKDCCTYKTYVDHITSSSVALIAFRLVFSGTNSNQN